MIYNILIFRIRNSGKISINLNSCFLIPIVVKKKLEFKPKTNKKEKSQQKHIVSNDKKGGKFIQFDLTEKCANLFYKNLRNME